VFPPDRLPRDVPTCISWMQARFAWVFRLLEQYPEERSWDAELAFPEAAPEERLRQARAVREWLNKSPLGRRPLVKVRPFDWHS
jgi:hypothetical protein